VIRLVVIELFEELNLAGLYALWIVLPFSQTLASSSARTYRTISTRVQSIIFSFAFYLIVTRHDMLAQRP